MIVPIEKMMEIDEKRIVLPLTLVTGGVQPVLIGIKIEVVIGTPIEKMTRALLQVAIGTPTEKLIGVPVVTGVLVAIEVLIGVVTGVLA